MDIEEDKKLEFKIDTNNALFNYNYTTTINFSGINFTKKDIERMTYEQIRNFISLLQYYTTVPNMSEDFNKAIVNNLLGDYIRKYKKVDKVDKV